MRGHAEEAASTPRTLIHPGFTPVNGYGGLPVAACACWTVLISSTGISGADESGAVAVAIVLIYAMGGWLLSLVGGILGICSYVRLRNDHLGLKGWWLAHAGMFLSSLPLLLLILALACSFFMTQYFKGRV